MSPPTDKVPDVSRELRRRRRKTRHTFWQSVHLQDLRDSMNTIELKYSGGTAHRIVGRNRLKGNVSVPSVARAYVGDKASAGNATTASSQRNAHAGITETYPIDEMTDVSAPSSGVLSEIGCTCKLDSAGRPVSPPRRSPSSFCCSIVMS